MTPAGSTTNQRSPAAASGSQTEKKQSNSRVHYIPSIKSRESHINRMAALEEFVLELATVEAIKFGSFKLKSGQV